MRSCGKAASGKRALSNKSRAAQRLWTFAPSPKSACLHCTVTRRSQLGPTPARGVHERIHGITRARELLNDRENHGFHAARRARCSALFGQPVARGERERREVSSRQQRRRRTSCCSTKPSCLIQQGDAAAACPKLEEKMERLEPGIGTKLNLAELLREGRSARQAPGFCIWKWNRTPSATVKSSAKPWRTIAPPRCNPNCRT